MVCCGYLLNNEMNISCPPIWTGKNFRYIYSGSWVQLYHKQRVFCWLSKFLDGELWYVNEKCDYLFC